MKIQVPTFFIFFKDFFTWNPIDFSFVCLVFPTKKTNKIADEQGDMEGTQESHQKDQIYRWSSILNNTAQTKTKQPEMKNNISKIMRLQKMRSIAEGRLGLHAWNTTKAKREKEDWFV